MCMWLHVGLWKYIPAAVAAVSELLSSREITFGPREPWKVILDLSMIPVGKAENQGLDCPKRPVECRLLA